MASACLTPRIEPGGGKGKKPAALLLKGMYRCPEVDSVTPSKGVT